MIAANLGSRSRSWGIGPWVCCCQWLASTNGAAGLTMAGSSTTCHCWESDSESDVSSMSDTWLAKSSGSHVSSAQQRHDSLTCRSSPNRRLEYRIQDDVMRGGGRTQKNSWHTSHRANGCRNEDGLSQYQHLSISKDWCHWKDGASVERLSQNVQ